MHGDLRAHKPGDGACQRAGRGGAGQVAEHGGLPSLHLREAPLGALGDNAASALASALRTEACGLRFLGLSGTSRVGNRGATRLALAMRKEACVLTSLDLSDNIVGDEGAQALAAALCTAARLTRLDLAGNLVGDAGATALAAALGTQA